MNKLKDVDVFDITNVEPFAESMYGWEIHVPLHASGKAKEKKIVPGIKIFDVIKNDCRVNLSSEDFENDWACITFIQENKNSGFAYESVFYKLPKTLTVKSVEDGREVVQGITKVKNIYGLRYYFLPREQLINSLWRKKLDFENKQQKNVSTSGCENYLEPSNLEKILITQTKCVCFEIKKNPNEKCNAEEKYYLAAVDHAKKSYIKTGVGLSFKETGSDTYFGPTECCGIVTDCNLCKNQLQDMYKRNKPDLITQNVDGKNELSKNPFLKFNDRGSIYFCLNYVAIFNHLKNIPLTLIPKKVRKLLQKQKGNNTQRFYLRCEICYKSDDTSNEYNEDFSYQNKNGVKNRVGKVCSFYVRRDGQAVYDKYNSSTSFSFKEIYEMKLYIGTERGVDFLIPDECMCFTCVDVSEKKISFAIINRNGEIATVFYDFVQNIYISNLTVCKENKRYFEQFKSLPSPTKKEIDEQYQNFIDKRNPNHEFGAGQNEINMLNITSTNQNISSTDSEVSSSSNGFLTCIKNFLDCHNGKIIISIGIVLGIGFAFGWIFSPVSIGVLIIFSLVDYTFKLPKTIRVFRFFTSCLPRQKDSEETNIQPNLEFQNNQIK